MLYIICPTCGELLGNKELQYSEGMQKLCKEFNIDDNLVSLDEFSNNEEFIKKKKALLDRLVGKHNICCGGSLPNTINLAKLLK